MACRAAVPVAPARRAARGRGAVEEAWRMTPEHRAILERMRSSAGVVRRAVEAAPPARFAVPPRDGEWSAQETLTHLRDVVIHVHGLRIRRLLYEESPLFADFDEEGYRRARLDRGEATGDLLATIVASTISSRGCSRRCPTPGGHARVAIPRSAPCPSSSSPGVSASTPRSTRRRSLRRRARVERA